MRIYVDFDDCLCETGRAFARLVSDMFGKNVPYEEMRYFNLQKAFDLTDEQYEQLLINGHEPEMLLSYEETPGASTVINEWIRNGHDVSVITGRPYSSYEASRTWLDRHGLQDARLYCLNKYGRDNFIKNSDFSLEPDDYFRMKFDYAVEDSPLAFSFFDHLPDLKVMVYDRPWNRMSAFPNDNYRRCYDWESIRKNIAGDFRMEHQIVMATEADTDAILSLYRAQVGREFCFWNEDYPGPETIAFDLSRDALFVMKDEKGEIIAAISAEEDEDVDRLDCWTPSLQPGGEYARLAVAPAWQNQGLAREMVVFILNVLRKRGFRSVHILVNRDNIKAIRSYAHIGFRMAGECEMYGQHFLCYEKEL